MVRRRIAIVLGVMAVAGLAAVSAAGASAATLELRDTGVRFGKLLTDSRGFTLYKFEKDTKDHDSCVAIPGCAHVWPPLLAAEGEPITVGPGLHANKVATITLPGGEKQITYNHKPLYGYIGDKGPEETGYVGVVAFGGYWFGVNRNGHGR